MAEQRPEPSTPKEREIEARANRALNVLAKWRAHFAGWQLGTRSIEDPECQAVRDHREATIMMRAELSALTGLLIDRGVFTAADYTEALAREAELLSADYSERFPGVTATEHGLAYTPEAQEHMKNWQP